MTYKEIQDLIKLISKTDLTEFKLKKDDVELVVRTKKFFKADTPAPMAQAPVVSIPQAQIAAPAPPVTTEQTVQTPATTSPEQEQKEESQQEYLEVKSPIVGTFYRAPGPDKPPFKKVGDSVEAGETVCIVEAMKLFNEIESEISGKIVKVLLEDASPVEYDQALFLVDPKG